MGHPRRSPTLLKCPQCGTLLDAVPGAVASCTACGFSAPVPAHGTPAHVLNPSPLTQPPLRPDPVSAPGSPLGPEGAPRRPPPAAPSSLLVPFAFLAAVSALATVYLSPYWFPFVLALAATGLGFGHHFGVDRNPQSLAAGVLGIVAFVFAVVFFAIA